MLHRLYPVLLAVALLLGALVCSLIVFEPFLNLPPFWNQLNVGVALEPETDRASAIHTALGGQRVGY